MEASAVTAPVTPLLEWAASVLAGALDAAGELPAAAGGIEALRGLVLSPESVRDRLRSAHSAPVAASAPPPLPDSLFGPLRRLGADAFELAAIGLAVAVELDPAAARAVAYLHDDMRLRRLSVDLLAALCADLAGDWTAGRRCLAPSSRLVIRGLLEVTAAGGDAEVRATPALAGHVVGMHHLAPELVAALGTAAAIPVATHHPAVTHWAEAPDQAVLHVHGAGPDVLGARVAASLDRAGRPAVEVDLAALDEAHARGLSAHCLLGDLAAVLVLPREGHPALASLLGSIDAVCLVDQGLALWQSPSASTLRPVASVELGSLEVSERAAAVAEGLRHGGIGLADPDGALPFARRYRHGPDAIAKVAGATRARLRAEERSTARDTDILAVAAVLAGAPLRDLATRVDRVAGWADLAVPEPIADELRELCARVDVRDAVLGDRGYARTLGSARGVSALFAGPSGAGKTLAASVVACELGLALYRVDLARIVSKYIGETERNLEAVFAAAESTDVVLLFDEADALFGRRSEVKDAHDRYANLEVAYLLQRMEVYDGVAILSTNLLRNLDEAFTRRLDFRVLFPFPAAAERRRIWRLMWPPGERLADDVDLDALALEHELSGGMIRNAVLAAAHLAETERAIVSSRHLEHAIAREHDKLGHLPRISTAEPGR
jgi:hypothetical protein